MASAKQLAARAKFKQMVKNKSSKVGKAAATGKPKYAIAKKK